MSTGFQLGTGRGLTPEELHAFLTETRIFAKVGTVGEDGWPNVNPAWYEYDGTSFWLVTKELAGFCRNLRRDPRVTLCIDNPETPYRRVMVRGTAEVVEGDWVEPTLDLPRVLVRIRPQHVSSWNGGGIDRTFTKPARWHEVAPGQSIEAAVAAR